MLNTNNILPMVERHKHMHIISRDPNNFMAHLARIQFELTSNDIDAFTASLVDYWIATKTNEKKVRTYLLSRCHEKLTDDWLLFLYDGLDKPITRITPIFNSKWSVLTYDIKGTFDYFPNFKVLSKDHILS